MEDVDLGPCRGRVYDQGATRWAVILPGANYLPDAPLLWFAREQLLAAGRNVVAVWDTFDRTTDPQKWVEDRLTAALRLAATDRRPVLIAKSLTTLAAPMSADLSLPAIWLTPLIGRSSPPFASVVINGLRRATAAALLVGGTADQLWDAGVARSITNATVLELAEADHGLQVPGDIRRSLDALRGVTEAIGEFVRRSADG